MPNEKLNNFNEDQFNLIIEGENVPYSFNDRVGDYIRMSVFDNGDFKYSIQV